MSERLRIFALYDRKLEIAHREKAVARAGATSERNTATRAYRNAVHRFSLLKQQLVTQSRTADLHPAERVRRAIDLRKQLQTQALVVNSSGAQLTQVRRTLASLAHEQLVLNQRGERVRHLSRSAVEEMAEIQEQQNQDQLVSACQSARYEEILAPSGLAESSFDSARKEAQSGEVIVQVGFQPVPPPPDGSEPHMMNDRKGSGESEREHGFGSQPQDTSRERDGGTQLSFSYRGSGAEHTDVSVAVNGQGKIEIELSEATAEAGWVRKQQIHSLRQSLEHDGLEVARVALRTRYGVISS